MFETTRASIGPRPYSNATKTHRRANDKVSPALLNLYFSKPIDKRNNIFWFTNDETQRRILAPTIILGSSNEKYYRTFEER